MQKALRPLYILVAAVLMWTCLSLSTLAYPAPSYGPQGATDHFKNGVPMGVAHRAAWRMGPENSLIAIDAAMKMGIDVVELDVKLTKDGVVVLSHDGNTYRCASGTSGNIADLTWAQLAQMPLKESQGGYGVADHVLTAEEAATLNALPHYEQHVGAKAKVGGTLPMARLDDAIDLIGDDAMINLDHCTSEELFVACYLLFRETGMLDQVFFKNSKGVAVMNQWYAAAATAWNGKHPTEVLTAKDVQKSILYVRIIGSANTKTLQSYLNNGDNLVMVEICIDNDDVDAAMRTTLEPWCKAKNVAMFVNTMWVGLCSTKPDTETTWAEMIDRGYTAIQTDRPGELARYLYEINRSRGSYEPIEAEHFNGFNYDGPSHVTVAAQCDADLNKYVENQQGGDYLRYDRITFDGGETDVILTAKATAAGNIHIYLDKIDATTRVATVKVPSSGSYALTGAALSRTVAAGEHTVFIEAPGNAVALDSFRFFNRNIPYDITPVNVATEPGQAPAMPADVEVVCGDARYRFAVNWAAIAPASYADAGSFEVRGTIPLLNAAVTATVTVGRFTPTILEDGLILWFDAKAKVTTNGTGAVTKWGSRVGNYSATPRVGTVTPVAVDAGKGLSFPKAALDIVLDNDNSFWNDRRELTVVYYSSSTRTTTGAIAYGYRKGASVLYFASAGSGGDLYFTSSQNEISYRFGSGDTSDIGTTYQYPSNIGTKFTSTAFRKNGTKEEVFVDGAPVYSGTSASATTKNIGSVGRIGMGETGYGRFNGTITAILVYDRALSDRELIAVQRGLAQCLTGKYTVTYAVEGGSFPATAKTTERVNDGKKPVNVPTGMTPDATHKAGGAWYRGNTKLSGTPANETIVYPTTYTYKFDVKPQYTVGYAVEGGAFAAGTLTKETVYDGAKPAKVPAKMTPDAFHKAGGAWYRGNTKLSGTPANETANVTYTYKFDKKSQYTVTYAVDGGSFAAGTATTETVNDGGKPAKVPTGMTPDASHKNSGAWYKGTTKLSGTPANEVITANVTFTYKFDKKAQYTVTYAVDGGAFAAGTATTETVNDGGKPVKVPTGMVPDATHKNSGAWYRGTTKLCGTPANEVITANVTFTYKFDKKAQYTVTYAIDGGAFAAGTATTEVVNDGGKPVKVPTGMTPDASHKNSGAWYRGTTKLSGTPANEVITANVTFTYRFDKKAQYTVTYAVDGGSFAAGTATTETVNDGGKPVKVPTGMTPDASHKNSGAWYRGTTKLSGTPANEVITANVMFTYKFDKKAQHTVTYTIDGGSFAAGTATTETVNDGGKPAKVPTGMTPDASHKNSGAWYRGTTKLSGTPANEVITANVTFTYKFDKKAQYTVTYAVDGGAFAAGTTTTETVNDGGKPAKVPTGMVPDASHKTTGAWYKGSTKLSGTPANEVITANVTFTYKFDKKAQYTVTYTIDGGAFAAGTATTEVVNDGGKPVKVPTGMMPDASHKNSGAWYRGTTKLSGTPANEVITANVTFTYKFDKKAQYTVTYAVDGGSFAAGTATTETVNDGGKPAKVPTGMVPDASHNNSGAWYRGTTKLSGTPANEVITANVTFTYKFDKKAQYTVTYAVDGGAFAAGTATTETVNDGGKPAKVPTGMTPDATHKNSGAWYKGSTKLSGTPANEVITANVTFTYKFDKKAQYTVTYAVDGGAFAAGTATTEVVNDGGKPVKVPTGMTPDASHKNSGAWYRGTTKLSGTPANEVITANVTFTYKFDKKAQYTVTYAVDGGAFAAGTATTETVNDGGKPVKVPTGMTPDATHKNSGAWYRGTTKLSGTPANEVITANVTFTYKFDKKAQYTVTYAVDGGSFAAGTATTETVNDGGKPAKVPTGMVPDATHKNSGAWYKGSTKLSGTPANEVITANVTYTYKFDIKARYTVTYAVEGGGFGINDPVSEPVYEGNRPANVPTNMTPDAAHKNTGAWYRASTKLSGTPADEVIDRNVTYTYKFDKKAQYTVTYAINGGAFAPATATSEKVYEGAMPAKVPTGMTPDAAHKATGTWYRGTTKLSGTPAGETITANVTYTYKFDQKSRFTVRYTINGGGFGIDDPSSELVYDGAKPANIPTGMTPDATHKATGAWYKGSTKLSGTPADETITTNATFTYRFDEKARYTVTYAVDGGSFAVGTATTEAVYDGAKPAKVPTGMTPDATHKATGAWYKGSTKLSGTPANEAITANVTYTYRFDEKARYTVTYTIDGGSFAVGTATTEAVYDGAKPAKVPTNMTPDATHKTTGAWYKGSTKLSGTPANEVITANVTYTYKFDKKSQFTVTYAVDGGGFAAGTATTEAVYDGGKPAKVPTGMTPDATHKNSGAWYRGSTKLSGTPANEAITANVTYTYKFDEKARYTVTYTVDGGAFAAGTATTEAVYDGAKPTKVPTNMTPDATHKASGAWYKGSTKLSGTPANEVITANVTYTYKFDKKSQFTVTYAVDGGSFASGTTITETVYDGAKPANVPTGMTPDAIHKASGAWYKGSTKLSGTPANEAITANVTYTYKFDEKARYTVTYAVDGGSFASGTTITETVYDGAKPANVPTGMTPDATHKTTGAWYKGSTKLSGTPANEVITANVTYTYKFDEKDRYTLTYIVNGGSAVAAGVYEAGAIVPLTATPTREGFIFTGWYAEADLVTAVTAVTMDGDKTVYAGWEPESPANDCPSKSFKDINAQQWHHVFIDFVVANGLMNGVSPDRFAPETATARAMIVTILYRLEGEAAVAAAAPFSDVPAGQWYTAAVIWADQNDIVNGFDDGTFRPLADVTREQLAAILFRYADYKGYNTADRADLSKYRDAATVGGWAYPAMSWANSVGLIDGRTATTLAPKGNAKRCEAAAIITRFLENIR